MTPTAQVILAYRDAGCPHRRAAYGYVIDHVWAGWDVTIADSGQEPFSRGGSFNQGAEASSADVLVFADADVVPDVIALEAAVTMAAETGATVYPYDSYLRLTDKATAGILADPMLSDLVDEDDFEWSELHSVGGIFVVRRDAYLSAGGCDPRFVGWGFEDVAWSAVSATLLGDHVRCDASLLHLWHPWDPHSGPATKVGREREVYEANVALCDQYTAAIGDGPAIRAVRAEAAMVAVA